MKILDLFCGAGGFSHGFIKASPHFQIELGIDIDFRALRTYKSNTMKTQVYNKNIQEIHSCDILDRLDNQSPDIILSSPPCESFSIANVNRKKSVYDQLYADEKGRLVLETIRLIIDLEPSIFIIENVPQLGSKEMQYFILNEFSRSPYRSIYFNTLEANNYGVPSFRRRVFISNVKFSLQDNYRGKTVKDAFKSLPEPNPDFNNHEVSHIPLKIMKKIHRTPPGGALVYFRGSGRGTYRNYIRLHEDQPSPTVMGKSRFIHPFAHRLCTVREHARLMSYPDNFQFHGPINWQFNQVGESVPPLLAEVIAKQVLKSFPKN